MRETKLEQHVKKAGHSHKGEKQNSSTGTSVSERLLLRVKRAVLSRGKGRSKGSILTVSKAHSLVCFFPVQSKLAETIHSSRSMISLLIPNIIQLSSSIPSLPATPLTAVLEASPLAAERGGMQKEAELGGIALCSCLPPSQPIGSAERWSEGHGWKRGVSWTEETNCTTYFKKERGLGTKNRPPYSSSGKKCSAAVFSAQCCWTLCCEFVHSGVASGQPE